MKNVDVIIVGAGPAGLFAAKSFTNTKLKVILLEATEDIGRKLLISGAGQCNYTNIIDIKEFYNKYGENGKFLKPAFYGLDNKKTIEYFKSRGIDYTVNDIGKVFPSTLSARDILNTLLEDCKRANVEIKTKKRVNKISKQEEEFIVSGEDFSFSCKRVIMAMGGNSYQHTGSKGDGVKIAGTLGIKIVDIKPALTPVFVKDYIFTDLSGISFRDIEITQWRNNKKLRGFSGDLLFTHRNLSGPVILNNSRYFEKGDMLKINFINLSFDVARDKLVDLINNNGGSTLKNIVIKGLDVPKRFCELLLEEIKLPGDIRCGDLKKNDRTRLIKGLTEYEVIIEKLGEFKNAMVTRGGICLSGVNKKTMESKNLKGMYFVGELLDLDGDTGGFNIQAAFSTGELAARSIIKTLKGDE